MAGPVFTASLGSTITPGSSILQSAQLGRMQLGGSGPFTYPPVLPLLDKTHTTPFLSHLFSPTLTFKKSLGPLLGRPVLKWTLNGGHHPIQIDLPLDDTSGVGPSQGDVVRLTEQGGDGLLVYTGIINDLQRNVDSKPPFVSLLVDPLITELGEAPFNHNYTAVTDIAQMARDAVNQSMHLTYTPQSIPDSGVGAIFNFHATNSLDVFTTIKHIGGPNFWFYVDEYGVVWFQAVNLGGKPAYTLVDGFSVRKKKSPIASLKNYIIVAGGLKDAAADGNALYAIYSDPVSQRKYGTRFLSPILYYPAAVDQGTLNVIALTIGTVMNKIRDVIEVTLPTFGNRFLLGRFGGPSIRYWEPSTNPLKEPINSTGSYSPNYVILDVEMDGPSQKLILGDLPVTADDFKYMIDGTVARLTHTLLIYPPVSTIHYSIVGAGGGVGSS